MHALPWIPALLALFCSAAPQAEVPPERAAATASDHFPTPPRGISLGQPSDAGPTLLTLVDQLAAIAAETGIELVASPETRQVLAREPIGLFGPAEAPARSAWAFAESLLAASAVVLVEQPDVEPRVVRVVALETQESRTLRQHHLLVPEERVALYARHPALMIQTVVSMPDSDSRQAANAMRALLVDAHTQVLVAASEHSMIVAGTGTFVAHTAATLRRVAAADSAAAEARRARGEERGEQPGGEK